MVVLEGGRARDYDGNGVLLDEGKVIPDGSHAPFAFWLEASPPHSVHNIDTSPIHLIRVEVKPPISLPKNAGSSGLELAPNPSLQRTRFARR
jgi:hypothetical protein